MKLNTIYKSLLSEVLTKKDLNALKLANKPTYPKIPTDKIFFNEVPDMLTILKVTKNAFNDIEKRNSKGFKKETVNVKMIVPTQINISVDNLKSTDKAYKNTNAELVKYNQFYFVIDGHHRISNAILNGLDEITAFVYHEKNINESVLVEDYPEAFNMEYFKTLKSFKERIDYCERELTRISSGSSRIVYKIDDEKVLKLAKNKKGLAQNSTEIELGRDNQYSNALAEIYDYNENNLWVEMTLAMKAKVNDFKRLLGVSFEELGLYLEYYYNNSVKHNNQLSKKFKGFNDELYQSMWDDSGFFYDLFSLISNYETPVGDFKRINSYGVVKENEEERIVVIDYGLTGQVYDSYYS